MTRIQFQTKRYLEMFSRIRSKVYVSKKTFYAVHCSVVATSLPHYREIHVAELQHASTQKKYGQYMDWWGFESAQIFSAKVRKYAGFIVWELEIAPLMKSTHHKTVQSCKHSIYLGSTSCNCSVLAKYFIKQAMRHSTHYVFNSLIRVIECLMAYFCYHENNWMINTHTSPKSENKVVWFHFHFDTPGRMSSTTYAHKQNTIVCPRFFSLSLTHKHDPNGCLISRFTIFFMNVSWKYRWQYLY